jgi:hypothetical protein
VGRGVGTRCASPGERGGIVSLSRQKNLVSRTYLALVHYPVFDKNRRIVATSITNLDIHDIARSSKTYGLACYFLVHPVAAQRELAQRILNHWQGSRGQEQNDFRSDALSIVRVTSSLEETIEQITLEQKARPLIVGTSAVQQACSVTAKGLLLDPVLQDRPLLLVFGTGWGLASAPKDSPDVMTSEGDGPATVPGTLPAPMPASLPVIDKFLGPVRGTTAYNHLSVRSAAGIILDRLFAQPEPNSGEHSL